MLCWLASCADPAVTDPELRQAGRKFLELLAQRASVKLPDQITRIKIHRQLTNIDVVIEIDEDLVFLIEDKAGSCEHSEQLNRYLNSARLLYPNRLIAPLYIQTHAQPNYGGVCASGFTVVDRRALFGALPDEPTDSILRQFREHLEKIESEYQSFRRGRDWSSKAWAGYCQEISELIGCCGWGYVSNPNGGFYAAYWGEVHFGPGHRYFGLGHLYMQISQERLSVRVHPQKHTPQSQLDELYWKAREYPEWEVYQPRRPGRGETRTLVYLELEHRLFDQNDNIRLEDTAHRLQEYAEMAQRFGESLRS